MPEGCPGRFSVSALLVALIVLGAVTGCGSSDGSGPSTDDDGGNPTDATILDEGGDSSDSGYRGDAGAVDGGHPDGGDGGDGGVTCNRAGGSSFATCDLCEAVAAGEGGCCYNEVKACEESADCQSLETCIDACTNDDCRDMCATTYPAGQELSSAARDCVGGYDAASTPGACGTICGTAAPPP